VQTEPLVYRYIQYHFIWHGWDVWTNNFWTIGIQGTCSECNNILFSLFDMCKLAISEPLVYRLYVWSAISFYLACLTCAKLTFSEPLVSRVYVWSAMSFYLACLTCANRQFLNHWYIGYMFGVKSHFSWHVWTDNFWPRAVSYIAPCILIKSRLTPWHVVKNRTPYRFLLCQVQSDFGVLEYQSFGVLDLL